VIDWGLAKDLDDGPADETSGGAPTREQGLTMAGEAMGTPVYMPPEQAIGGDVDARADVYALGASLYHLLAGVVPYREARNANDVLQRVLAGPPRPLRELAPDVPPELLAIVDKAMTREPGQRFRDAEELATELLRFQAGQLVGVHRYDAMQLLRRWLRRHRGPVVIAAVALVLLVTGGIYSFLRIASERDAAQAERDKALALHDDRALSLALRLLPSDPTSALAYLKELKGAGNPWARASEVATSASERGIAKYDFSGSQWVPFPRGFTVDGTCLVLDIVEGEELRRAGPPSPTRACVRLDTGSLARTADTPVEPRRYEFTTRSSADFDGPIVMIEGSAGLPWRTQTPDVRGPLSYGFRPPGRPTAVSRASTGLAAVGYESGTIAVFDSVGGGIDLLQAHDQAIDTLFFSPDGRWLVSSAQLGARGGTPDIRVWDLTGASNCRWRRRCPGTDQRRAPADPEQLRAWLANQTTSIVLDDGWVATPYDLADGGRRQP
jgi:hypothetical protein